MTGIESENAFYSKGEDRLITDSFRLWSVHFSETTTKGSDSGSSSSRHYIRFDEWFIRSFQDHYLKGLDTNFYWELDSPFLAGSIGSSTIRFGIARTVLGGRRTSLSFSGSSPWPNILTPRR